MHTIGLCGGGGLAVTTPERGQSKGKEEEEEDTYVDYLIICACCKEVAGPSPWL